MRRRFSIETFQRVPDGTLVAPFINPLDNASGLSCSAMPHGVSVAAGIIEAGSRSAIHLLSQVTQVGTRHTRRPGLSSGPLRRDA